MKIFSFFYKNQSRTRPHGAINPPHRAASVPSVHKRRQATSSCPPRHFRFHVTLIVFLEHLPFIRIMGREVPYVAKLVIERNRIYTENANLSHGHGALSLATFEPFPKNPPISKVFREIGLADELGSGMRNTYKYTRMYSGGEPQFVEGNVFRITIPLSEVATATVGPGSSGSQHGAINEPINGAIKLKESERRVLEAIRDNPRITRKEIIEQLKVGESTVYRAVQKLKAEGLIERIGSNKTGYWKVLL